LRLHLLQVRLSKTLFIRLVLSRPRIMHLHRFSDCSCLLCARQNTKLSKNFLLSVAQPQNAIVNPQKNWKRLSIFLIARAIVSAQYFPHCGHARLLAPRSSRAITVLQLQFYNYNFTIYKFYYSKFYNYNFTISISQLQFYNCNFTIAILQLQFYNCNFTITFLQLQFYKCNIKSVIYKCNLQASLNQRANAYSCFSKKR
jgi:hypothetical protein